MIRPDGELVALMESAVGFAVRHVESGGLPFVGLLVGEGGHVFDYGVNEVMQTGDPTAHAEIVAMRHVMAEHGLSNLKGFTLLATGEPCGLCYRFALQRQVERIYVAVDADTAAAWGFDYRGSYPAQRIDRERLTDRVSALPVPGGLEPFERHRHLRRAGASFAPGRPSTTDQRTQP